MKGPLPPHVQTCGFLSSQEVRTMLNWVMENEQGFRAARVTHTAAKGQGRVDPDTRISLVLRDLGPLEDFLKQRMFEILPELLEQLRVGGPRPNSLDLELSAYGDGAHFKTHVDTFYGEGRVSKDGSKRDRLLSGVYYFHNEPKAFSGGELRLLRMGAEAAGAGPEDVTIVEPLHNSLTVFPSWAPHEVLPVRVPSGDFADYRFALNCWFCKSSSI